MNKVVGWFFRFFMDDSLYGWRWAEVILYMDEGREGLCVILMMVEMGYSL